MVIRQSNLSTKISFAIVEGCQGIQSIRLGSNQKSKIIRSASAKRLCYEIEEYLSQNRKKFSKYILEREAVSLFAFKVLEVIKHIPYGQVKTYSEVAELIGSPYASRAVGNVLNKNSFPILIPCHRVVRKSGAVGGFSSGPRIKKWLLDLERVNSK